MELAKALLQTAYFSFFSLRWILLQSSKPSRRLALQSLPPLPPTATTTTTPHTQTFSSFSSAIECQWLKKRENYLSVFLFHLLDLPDQPLKKSQSVRPLLVPTGLWRKGRAGTSRGSADRHGKWTRTRSQSRRFSIRALWHRVALCREPHGSSCAMRATLFQLSQSCAPMFQNLQVSQRSPVLDGPPWNIPSLCPPLALHYSDSTVAFL